MSKSTTQKPNGKGTRRKSCKVKQALANVLKAIPSQGPGDRPAVTIARLVTDTAKQQGTPFVLNGDSVCISIEGKKRTLSKDVVNWLIEAVATKLRVKGLPFCEAVSKAYYLQFVHAVMRGYFTNKKAA